MCTGPSCKTDGAEGPTAMLLPNVYTSADCSRMRLSILLTVGLKCSELDALHVEGCLQMLRSAAPEGVQVKAGSKRGPSTVMPKRTGGTNCSQGPQPSVLHALPFA